jgi:phage tail-like protein
VEISEEATGEAITTAGFAECEGLELTLEPKTVREGGRQGPVHVAGPVSYGQLTLKRGLTQSFDLWNWFERVASDAERGLRAEVVVVMLSSGPAPGGSEGSRMASERPEQARFVLTGCLPVKLKGPSLNARDGLLAIEEVQIAFETLSLVPPSEE